jgi:amino acid adenylation domain-containing protein
MIFPHPVSICAPHLFLNTARRLPNGTAIEDATGSIDYRGLVTRAATLSGALRRAGVCRGSVVAVCLPRSADQIIAMLGAWFAGAAYMPMDPASPGARLAALFADADCAALVAGADLGPRITRTVPLVAVDAAAPLDEPEIAPIDPESIAYVIYTSGSTGTPKAVEVTHANLAALIAWHCEAFDVGAGTRTSQLAGLGFDAAAWEVWPTLANGGTLALIDDMIRLDPAALRDWLVDRRIEVAFAPTALAEPMVAMDWPPVTSLRFLLTGAERLKARPAPGLPFALVNNYGPTEATVVATSGLVSPEGSGLPSIGRPIAGTKIHLLDDQGREGAAGEICIGGAQVARGYRGDPRQTAEKFIEHPTLGRLYRTGDRAAWRPDGELDFLGRFDGQIKLRGHRIEPAEVAASLGQLPGVSTSAVVLREGELVAYVVPADGVVPFAGALRASLADALPAYMIPARFALIGALPLTPNGKLDAAALPPPAACAMHEGKGAATATTPTQRRLLEIIGEVIGRDDIGIDDDFFLLGGHSLLGTQLVIRARAAFGVELTLLHLFEGRSVARLAETVEKLVTELLDTMSDEDILRMAAS